VPPNVIFPNRTPAKIARERPLTAEAPLRASGVGQAKLERYGAAGLEVLGARY